MAVQAREAGPSQTRYPNGLTAAGQSQRPPKNLRPGNERYPRWLRPPLTHCWQGYLADSLEAHRQTIMVPVLESLGLADQVSSNSVQGQHSPATPPVSRIGRPCPGDCTISPPWGKQVGEPLQFLFRASQDLEILLVPDSSLRRALTGQERDSVDGYRGSRSPCCAWR